MLLLQLKCATPKAGLHRALDIQIFDPKSMFNFCSSHLYNTKFLFGSKNQTNEVRYDLKSRYDIKPIPGTKSYNPFTPVTKNSVKKKRSSN